MIDHHVDRLGVEGQQCPELTSTNRSIGLITSNATIARSDKLEDTKTKVHTKPSTIAHQKEPLDDLVAIARGNTPDPIPNSAVKTLSANGTAS